MHHLVARPDAAPASEDEAAAVVTTGTVADVQLGKITGDVLKSHVAGLREGGEARKTLYLVCGPDG